MEFEYFTDQIVLNNGIVNNNDEIMPLDNFINSSLNFLNTLGINFQQSTIFYKRNKKGASVLGIQLLAGDNEDLSNYLIYDCMPFKSGKSIFCNIDMHVCAKTSSNAMQFASLASNDVTEFFNLMEQTIVNNGQDSVELDYMKNIILQKKKQSVFAKILKRFK